MHYPLFIHAYTYTRTIIHLYLHIYYHTCTNTRPYTLLPYTRVRSLLVQPGDVRVEQAAGGLQRLAAVDDGDGWIRYA